MKQVSIKLAVATSLLFFVLQSANAQTYRYALKFNYGIVNYNNKNSEFLKKPLASPFSLGGEFQSNFSKVFTNSIGFNTYKWTNNSSYNIQDMLFFRNNTRQLNRFKPQIGFGVGFEEAERTVANISYYTQYVYVPINIGIQTDLSNRISLGIFAEIKYGFDIHNFNIKNGSILPNNTAGISVSYRFSKVKERSVYPEINWNSEGAVITLDGLKDYENKKAEILPSVETKFVKPITVNASADGVRLMSDSVTRVTKMKALTPMLVADSILLNQDSLSMSQLSVANLKQSKKPNVKANTVFTREDSLTIYQNVNNETTARIAYLQDSLRRNKTTSKFKLGDFTEASAMDTVFIVNRYINAESALPAPTNAYSTVPALQPYNYSVPQNSAYLPYNAVPQTVAPLQVENKRDKLVTGLQVAETGSSALLNAQLGKLINLQTQTLALLSQNKLKSDSSSSTVNKVAMDSLMQRITDLEDRLNKFSQPDSLIQKIPEVNEKKRSDVLGFCVISYAANKTDLTDLQRNLIVNDVFKSYLKADNRNVLLESYTDKSGSAAYNKKLSDLRLKRAVQFLLVLGVKPNDIITNSYGDSKSSDEVNPEERRLVIKIVENGK